jgi:transcriptional regulator with XRE-family HTH domain
MTDLKAMIRSAGLTQTAVARHLGVSTSNVSRWAAREADIPTREIEPLAALLGVDSQQVLAVAVACPRAA